MIRDRGQTVEILFFFLHNCLKASVGKKRGWMVKQQVVKSKRYEVFLTEGPFLKKKKIARNFI